MKIDVGELQEISNRLFDHLKEIGINNVDVPADYYWHIPNNEIYDPYAQPQNLNIGQLTEDWKELKRTLDDDQEPLAHDLVWLASMIRAIGEHVVG